MVRVISQETFDGVVKENMEDFDMSREDAVQEAKEQFKSQGVNLDNIVTDAAEHDHVMVKAIQALAKWLEDKSSANTEEVCQNCDVISAECRKGLAERVMATKHQAYTMLVQTTDFEDVTVQRHAIRALKHLLDGNPDPLEPAGFKALLTGLNSEDAGLTLESLGCTLNCCVRHELNRQNLIRNGVLAHLDRLFEGQPQLVIQVWQALVQDDDVRVPFGQAHEHAREIVEEHSALTKLTQILTGSPSSKELPLFLSCLSSLCVRNEYCQTVVSEGGLKATLELLVDPDQTREVVSEALKLLKALAGNDNVKRDIKNLHGVPVMVNAMTKHIGSKAVCNFGSAALMAVSLRSPENAEQIMETGGGHLLTQIIKTHKESPTILMSTCNAIRNIVSRSRELTEDFVDLDIETLLLEIRQRHPDTEDAVKAAQRDLGLKVDLKEQWTGGAVKND